MAEWIRVVQPVFIVKYNDSTCTRRFPMMSSLSECASSGVCQI